jgi:hypothetical protein
MRNGRGSREKGKHAERETIKEIADHLEIHYTTAIKLIKDCYIN